MTGGSPQPAALLLRLMTRPLLLKAKQMEYSAKNWQSDFASTFRDARLSRGGLE